MIAQFLAEILGTFIFLSIIIISVNAKPDNSFAWLKIGLGLAISILLVANISGGHLNPAVSFMFYLNNNISIETLIVYIIGQLIGATLAFFYYLQMNKK
jgi:glycerol uptake facilitator-like aquaporin